MGADSNVQLPPSSTGVRLRIFGPLPGDGGQDFLEGVYEADPDGNFAIAPEDPKTSVLSSSSLGAGGSVTLQAAVVTSGKSGRLSGVSASASVPIKVQVQSFTPAADIDTFFQRAFAGPKLWRPPHRSWTRLAGDGTNRFQVRITNLELLDAADVYATLYWDEV